MALELTISVVHGSSSRPLLFQIACHQTPPPPIHTQTYTQTFFVAAWPPSLSHSLKHSVPHLLTHSLVAPSSTLSVKRQPCYFH